MAAIPFPNCCRLLSSLMRLGSVCMSFCKKVFKDMSLRVEGSQCDGLPRLSGLDVAGFGFSHSAHKDKRVFVAKNVFSRTWYQREMGMNSSIRMFHLRSLDGEVTHAGSHFVKEPIDEAGTVRGCTGGVELRLLIECHPVKKPWI